MIRSRAMYFCFAASGRIGIKAIAWDRNGLAIWYKRLEHGKYKWPTRDAASIELTEHELATAARWRGLHAHPAIAAIFFARATAMSCAKYLSRELSLAR